VIDLHARRMLTTVPALAGYLRRERPSVLLSGLNHANLAAIWARRLSGARTRLFVSVHSTLSRATAHARRLQDKLLPVLMKWLYPAADGIVAVSESVANDLVAYTGLSRAHLHTIYNPAVTPELQALAAQPVRHPWFIEKSMPVILGVGRLTAAKDFSNLLRAFAYAQSRRPARLLILGEGEERLKLEQLAGDLGIRDAVEMPGFAENPYVYMAKADLFVLSSAWEGLPVALLEAMALGVPVVSTDCQSGPREILAGGQYGALVPVANAQRLGEAILQALYLPRQPVVAAAWEPFTQQRVTRAYLNLFTGGEQ